MHHFTNTAYIVTSCISGRHGYLGATSSVIGVFNMERKANYARERFISDYIHAYGVTKLDRLFVEKSVKVIPIMIDRNDEKIIGKVYE